MDDDPTPAPAIEFNTIRDFIRGRMTVSAYCKGRDCHRGAHMDLAALTDRLGADFDVYVVNLRPRMRCTKCDRRGATFIVSPHLTTAAELFEKEKERTRRQNLVAHSLHRRQTCSRD
jgi:hypothetical protein